MNAHVCCSHRLTWLYTPARHSRKIGDHILSLNDSDLKELCAAYKMEAIAAKSRDQIKEELINLLIHADRNYDLTALAEYQAAVAAKKMAALEAAKPATGKARKAVY